MVYLNNEWLPLFCLIVYIYIWYCNRSSMKNESSIYHHHHHHIIIIFSYQYLQPSLTLKACQLFAIISTLPAVQHTSPSSPLLVSFNKFVSNQTMHLHDQDIKLMNMLLHSTIAHQHHFHHHHTTIIHSCPRHQHNLSYQ